MEFILKSNMSHNIWSRSQLADPPSPKICRLDLGENSKVDNVCILLWLKTPDGSSCLHVQGFYSMINILCLHFRGYLKAHSSTQ